MEGRRNKPSIWKKMKKLLKSFVGISSENTTPENTAENETEAGNKWINASRYISGSSRRITMSNLFSRIEEMTDSNQERMRLFREQATKEMKEWWKRLTVKPINWEDLKEWLAEDIDSVEDTQSNRHARNSHLYNPPEEKE